MAEEAVVAAKDAARNGFFILHTRERVGNTFLQRNVEGDDGMDVMVNKTKRGLGWRKVIVFTEALVAFGLIVIWLGLQDAGAIVAVGTQVSLLLGAAIYGNVQEHKSAPKGE